MAARPPRSAPGAPAVRVRVTGVEGASGPWTLTRPFELGRDVACAVEVPHPKVSRAHLGVTAEGGRWWVRDLGSSNGTFHADGTPFDRAPLDGPL